MAAWVGLIESWSAVTSWHVEHQRPSICPPVSFPSGLKKKEEEGWLLPSGTPGLVSECVDVWVLWKTLPHQQNVAPSCRWEEWKRFLFFLFFHLRSALGSAVLAAPVESEVVRVTARWHLDTFTSVTSCLCPGFAWWLSDTKPPVWLASLRLCRHGHPPSWSPAMLGSRRHCPLPAMLVRLMLIAGAVDSGRQNICLDRPKIRRMSPSV